MLFELRALPRITSRIVKMEGRTFELWSPNSLQKPFLPGERRINYLPGIPHGLTERRYDGHAGKHDCLFFPQYLIPAMVHWPFMRRATEVLNEDPAAAAFEPLMDHWLRPMLSKPSKTWDSRPGKANESALTRLLGVRRWEEAVDLGVSFQRGLQEKEGWIAYLEARFGQRRMDLSALRAAAMPVAQEQYIGCWVNGLSMEAILRHLYAGIPCFIAHEYANDTVTRDMVDSMVPVYSDLVEGTDVMELLHNGPYQRLARLDSTRLDSIATGDDRRGARWLAPAAMETLSSSLYLEQQAELENSVMTNAPSQAATSSSSVPSENNVTANAPTQAATSNSSVPQAPSTLSPLLIPQAPDAKKDNLAHRELSYRIIDKDRAPWIVPPSIQSVKQNAEKWTKWELDSFNGAPAWILRGQKREIGADNEWYDRKRKRRLFFGSFTVPHGVTDEKRFGTPVPRFPFLVLEGGRAFPKSPSYWMYQTRDPMRLDAGTAPRPPHFYGLPLLANVAEETSVGSVAKGKGKGKVQRVYEDDDEDDDEDLGEHGMDVDEPDPREAPSNVVVIDNLETSIDAVMFRGLAADALYSCRVSPLVILRGQGRMWLRFSTTTEGRLAFGVLGSIAHGLQVSYSPNAMIDEVVRYTRDIWLLETTAGVSFVETRDAPTMLQSMDASVEPVPPTLPTPSVAASSSPTILPEDNTGEHPPILAAEEAPCAASPDVAIPVIEVMHPMEEITPSPPVIDTSTMGQSSTSSVSGTETPVHRLAPTAPRAMRGASTAEKVPLAEHFSDPRPTPLLRRLSGAVVPLQQRLSEPRQPLADRLSARTPTSAPLLDRLDLKGKQPGPSARCPADRRHASGTPASYEGEDRVDVESTPKRKKVRRRTRAGRSVKEMARIRAESSARASLGEAEASSSVAANPGMEESSSMTIDLPDIELEEGEVTAWIGEDEEMPDARWGDEEDDDRPMAGPSR
ncbi:hypothetical protein B0H13DRAFT_1867232 [Mycena leptocephala]|nr:hypothetical protein B0H13DRAFT_1867232 [Mycena leptocephala]